MKLVISDNLEEDALEKLKSMATVAYKPEDLAAELKDANALVVRSATKVTKELIDAAPKLKIIARAGVGLDNIDCEYCKQKGIKVVNTPGASTNAVAEITVGTILSCARNIAKANCQMKAGSWQKKQLTGSEIEGKTLGIIGYGRIGGAVGTKARALGMKTIAYNPPPRHDDGQITFVESLDKFLPQCDFITLHCVLTEETKNIINKETISKMKDGVIIVNFARGELLDEDALYVACKSGKIHAAALDVYREEPYKGKLLELDNVSFTPHIGAATKEAQLKIGDELVKLLK